MPAVKDLMNKEEPSTCEDLLAIPGETTNELGVYLKLIFENLENPTALSHFVYIGSAISWFAENAEKIQARKAAMTEVERAAFRARRAAQTRGYRARKPRGSPNYPVLCRQRISAEMQCARHSDKAKLQQRVNRARNHKKKVAATGDAQRIEEAELALKIAEVERWESAVEHGHSVKIVPSKEDCKMVYKHRAKQAQNA
ncbi:hypothetical protein BDV39DRAFT_204676 [Aspergillus sergii]|uniref:Uncharacterized protein n=1 Tax=Aspergillus sergii TaxID=1034303 RepID=A0A5N6X494_9EURO|nr:hypothetical protein BDV39DRAFT_204676 [Aspergillus sergii]